MTIRRVPDEDLDESTDGWTGDNVFVFRWQNSDNWAIEVCAMEFLQGGAEGGIRHAIATALSGVPGVQDVHEEDRERWAVSGHPSGEAMAQAVETALEPFADELNKETIPPTSNQQPATSNQQPAKRAHTTVYGVCKG